MTIIRSTFHFLCRPSLISHSTQYFWFQQIQLVSLNNPTHPPPPLAIRLLDSPSVMTALCWMCRNSPGTRAQSHWESGSVSFVGVVIEHSWVERVWETLSRCQSMWRNQITWQTAVWETLQTCWNGSLKQGWVCVFVTKIISQWQKILSFYFLCSTWHCLFYSLYLYGDALNAWIFLLRCTHVTHLWF